MKKILTLLILCMFCALSIVEAQTANMNIPDRVCMSLNNSTADQAKFTSINAYLNGGSGLSGIQLPVWTITTPTGSDAAYNILYSANTSPVKATKLQNTKSLTLEFLVPGTYTFRATITYRDAGGATQTRTVTKVMEALDCTIPVCSGGYAVMAGFNEDFGTMAGGAVRRAYPVGGVIQYPYQTTYGLADDYYVISGTTDHRNEWVKIPDHTGNANGAMLVVNSAYLPFKLYEKKVSGLCSGSVYNFSAWMVNVDSKGVFESNCLTDYKYAGVTFRVLNANDTFQVLGNFPTHSVSMKLGPNGVESSTWQRYGGTITIPSGVTDVLVRIINDKPGGCGNDIAIDDINFTYCSPIITAGLIGNNTSLKEVLCEGTPDTLTSSIFPIGYFTDPVYQWEMSDNNGASWFNVPFGTPRDSLLKIPAGELKGTKTVAADYLFRVRVYERGIADSLGCANPSSPIKITILPMPQLSLTKSQVCAGADVELEASGGFDKFTWKDLPGYEGATRTITLIDDTTIVVYGFVFYGEGGGKTCVDSNSAFIKVDQKPVMDVAPSTGSICFGEAVDFKINSSNAGKNIRWYRGIIDTPGSPDTTAMPEWNGSTQVQIVPTSLTDTIFSVIVRDGTCTVSSAPLIVKITPLPTPIRFPTQLNCSSVNTTGTFTMPDSSLIAPHTNEIGTWSIVSYTGIDVAPDETIEDYIKIFIPGRMGTRVSIPFGSTVVLGWTAKAKANNSCTVTSLDTLILLNDPTWSNAGPDSTQCGAANSVFTMNATVPDATLTGPAAETGRWTLISGSATIANINSPTTTVTIPAVGDVVLTWAITNAAGCGGNVDTVVLHKALPPTATLRPINICNTAGTFLVDSLTTTGTPTRYTLRAGTPALPGFVTVSDTLAWPITATYPITPLPAAGVYNFILTVSTGNLGCTTDVPFSVNISTPPTAPTGVTVGTPNICDTGVTTLTVVGGSLGKRPDGITDNAKWKWYRGACGGVAIDSGATITVDTITTTTTFYVRAEGSCGNTTCASGVVTVYVKPAKPNVGADQVHCSDSLFTMAAPAPTVGTGVWSILPGGTATITTPTSRTSTIFVLAGNTASLVWTVTNGVCVVKDTIVLRNHRRIQAIAGVDQNNCATPAFTLAGNSAGTGTGLWTVVSGTATITTPTSPTSAVTVATGTTATLRWTITNGTCVTTDDVVLTNYATPTVSVAGPAQTHCSDSLFTMAANAPTVGTGLWTVVSGTATITTPTSPTTTVFVLSGRTATLRWTISNGTCTASSSTVVLTNNAAPTPITPAPDQTHCSDSLFRMAATPASLGAGVWTIVSGTATITTPSSPTSTVFVLAGNTATLRWTITNGTCVLTDDVVLRNYRNIVATAGPDQNNCATPAFTLAANAPTPGTGLWTVVSGTATITTPTSPTSAVTVPTGSTATLRWTITNGTCVTTDNVVLTNYATPTVSVAGPAQAHCNVALFTMAANTPTVGTGLWTVVSGTATITTPTSPTTTVNVTAGNTATLRWTISNGTCTASSSTVVLTNNLNIVAAAGPDQNNCATPAFTLAGNAPTPGTGLWTVVSGTATITTPTSPTSAVTVPTGSTATLRWTITNGTCVTTDDVVLTNFATPTVSVAGPAQSHCNVALFTMAANAPVVGTGLWTVVSGTATITTPSSPTTTVNVTAGNTVTLRWTISNGNCPPSSSTVVLTNYVAPTPITPAPDQTHCNVALFTMAATPASVGTGVWTIVSGTATITTPSSPTTTVNVAAGNTATLRWTITNGTCVLTDDVVLTNNLNIVAAAGPDQSNCATPAFTLAGNAPTPGTGLWTVVSGTATITTPTSPTSAVTVPTGSTATLRWTITNGTCVTTDDVVLTNFATPTVSVAGPAQTHCNVALFTMAANTPTVGTGMWIVVSGAATITTPSSPTTTVNVIAGNTATLRWTISNGTCPPSTSTVVLTNNALPTTAAAGPDQSHCLVPNFVLAANTPVIGTGLWTLVSGTATITTPTSPTSGATVATGDSAVLVWTITNGTCISRDTVILRNSPRAVDANAGPAQEHCGDPVFTLAGNTPDLASAVGTWTVVSPASVTIAASEIHKPNAIVNVPGGVTATLRWTIANGSCSTFSDVTLTNFGPIVGNTITADQTLCATQTPAPLLGGVVSGGSGTYSYQWIYSVDSVNYTNVVGATNATHTPGVISQNTWFKRVVISGLCTPDTSDAVKLWLITQNPAVVTVPAAITTDCISGKDYRPMFGMPTFSHAPYSNETLTVTFVDDSTQVDACTKTIRRTWTATDRCGLTTSAQQTITVVDRTAPVFTTAAPANVTVNCDAVPAPVNLTANDACAGLMSVAPIEVRQDMPGACASNYLLIRKWVVADACGNVSDTLRQTITVRDLTPPVFNMTQPANISVSCDNIPARTDLTATDNCTPGIITVTPVDSIATIPGACAQNYRIIRKWVATDMCGNTTTLRQTITVQDTSRPVFSIPQPANITVDCDKVPALPAVTATDNCTAVVLVTVGQRKDFLSTTCSNNYRLIRTWTAKDDCGNTSIMSQTIIVQDTTRPVFNIIPPADTTVSCDAIPAPSTNLSATDNCSATSNVKISYTQSRQAITGSCVSNYRLIRTWTAKDECGNSTVIRQTITVTDTTRPVIDPAPANITVNCGEAIQLPATLFARDNCDATFPKRATMTEDPYTKDICAGYTIIRRWRIADACGNQATERVQTITVNPCPKPELDPTLPVNCSNNTKFAILLRNKVSKPRFTLVSIVPATAVTTPLTQTSNVFDLRGATQATFTVTDGVTGCVSDPVTYDLQYIAKPVVNIGRDTAICSGNSITLDAGLDNAAYTIRWSTGETSQTISVNTAGTYSATVTNGGCSTTDSMKLTIIPPPVVNIPDTNICDGQSVRLNAYIQGGTYIWSTGDSGPSITVNTTGQYWVFVTVGGCSTTDTINVTVNPAPNVTLTSDTSICPNETVMLTVDPDGGTVRWLDGQSSNSIVVSKPGDYWVTVTRNNCVVTDTVKVALKSAIAIDLGPDRDICTGGRVVVDGSNPDAISYLWNDGTTDPVKEITTAGKYIISVMDRFCSTIVMDSVNVNITGLPATVLPNDTIWCRGMPLVLTPTMGQATSIRWQDGSINPTYNVSLPGTYSVTVWNDCGTVTDQITIGFKDCDPKPQFPNAFTPNGDGNNDTFKPIVQGPMYDYELRIFNRWGELIFISKDSKTGWDGRYRGKLVENGTYVWLLSYKKVMGGNVNVVKGEITVIR